MHNAVDTDQTPPLVVSRITLYFVWVVNRKSLVNGLTPPPLPFSPSPGELNAKSIWFGPAPTTPDLQIQTLDLTSAH